MGTAQAVVTYTKSLVGQRVTVPTTKGFEDSERAMGYEVPK